MDKLFNNTWFIRIISFFIALMLFLMVNKNSQPSGVLPTIMAGTHTIEEVELFAYYNSEKYAIMEMPETVKVVLKGPQSTLTRFQLSRPSYEVYVDLAGKEAGGHSVSVQHRGFPQSLSVSIVPQSVRVVLQEKKTVTLPVEVELLNEDKMAEGYQVDMSEVNPKVVTVTAAEDVVSIVSSAKVIVDLEGVREDVVETVPVKFYDELGNELQVEAEPKEAKVNVTVQSPSKQVNIEVPKTGELPEGLRLESVTLEEEQTIIYGPQSILNEIETIETEPLDLSKLTGTETIVLNVQIPRGVEKVERESVRVVLEMTREEERTFEKVPITINNLAHGKSAQFLEPTDGKLNITFKGTTAQLNQVKLSDVTVFVDANGLMEGEHELALKMLGPSNVQYIASTDRVKIRITEESE